MADVAIVASSPTARSRLEAVTEAVRRLLVEAGHRVRLVQLRDLPQSALLVGDHEHPQLRWTCRMLTNVRGVVFVTPTYERSGSAILRAWLDLLPDRVLADKAIQTIGLGAFRSHAAGLDYTLARSVGDVDRVLPACFLFERWLRPGTGTWQLDSAATERLSQTTAALSAELDRNAAALLAS